ncbi:MAG: NADPH-dependent FMN reductase [Bacteroidota bacterium]
MILVLSTTNRPSSLSQVIAEYYCNYLKSKAISTQLLKLTDLPADFTKTALYAYKGKNEIFNQLIQPLQIAKKIVCIVPEYNGSFPGVLKAFIDGLDRSIFTHKKCALVGVSKGHQGAIIALSHLTDIFHYLGMAVYPLQPKLSKVASPTLAAVKAHQHYLTKLEAQADGFINF